jgi:hypothetical protein
MGIFTRSSRPAYVKITEEIEKLRDEEKYLHHKLLVNFSEPSYKQFLDIRRKQQEWMLLKAQADRRAELWDAQADERRQELDTITQQIADSPPSTSVKDRKEKVLRMMRRQELERMVTSDSKNRLHSIPTGTPSLTNLDKDGDEDGDVDGDEDGNENGDGDADGNADGQEDKDKRIESKKKKKKSTVPKPDGAAAKKFDKVKAKALQRIIEHTYPLNKFNFKTLEQCEATFSKSKAYTISREQFIEVIRGDPQLLPQFPDLSRLSKKELCSRLFRIAKGRTP